MWINRFVFLVSLIGLICFSGPIFSFKPRPSETAAEVARAPDIESYIASRERLVEGIKPELSKGIVWAPGFRQKKTPFSIVYLHGFSASRKDISPVVENLAQRMSANVFFTRLTAHGLNTGEEFANLKASDLFEDAREAYAVGKRIGDRVVVIGMSTGAVLASMLALDDKADIGALILLSPAFGFKDWRAKFVSGPLGPRWAKYLVGPYRDYPVENERHRYIWTHHYRSEGLSALMDLINHGGSLAFDTLRIPTLILYTVKDSIIDIGAIESKFAAIPSNQKKLNDLLGATRHELTGFVLQPQTVETSVSMIYDFLIANGFGPNPTTNQGDSTLEK